MIPSTDMSDFESAEDVIKADLDYICAKLDQEFPALSGRQLLITGGGGFLGYYLVQAALHWNALHSGAAPIRLTVFDNFIRGVPEWLTSLATNPNLTLVKHDVTHPLPSNFGQYQYIIHAASIASPTYYRKYPLETMDANVQGLRRLLDYSLVRKGQTDPVLGFLYFSTSEIYGDPGPEDIPTPETYRGNVSCTGPRACYDESKRYGETLCVNFAQQHGLAVKIARPFNNYGPGLKISDRRVLADFARDVLGGRDIVMLSDGSPTRTFCYVADATAGYYKILINGHAGESYNIGVETPEISMVELAERVAALGRKLFSYQGRVVRKESVDRNYLIDNPNRRCPVIAKARAHLGYDPGISMDDGLKRALIWYRDNCRAEDA